MAHEKFMKAAIEKAREGVNNGQAPFAACIVSGEKIIACEHNEVWENINITDHAEMRAIEVACKKLGTIDLSGCDIYATCEPCPMCFSAIHWARISTIIYGAKIEDAKRLGFRELTISNERMKEAGKSPVKIAGGFMKEECLAVFEEFLNKDDKKTY